MTEKSLGQISTAQFRSVMKRFAATVNVITSSDGTSMNGMTATAVCSVSADPPSVLIIVNRGNRSHPTIRASQAFAINILSVDQEGLATHFASKADEPFGSIDHRLGETGCPLLDNADAYLECRVMAEVESGSHTIFVGEVVASEVSNREPLLYHAGRYRALEQTCAACA